jgi:hypothetical protein
LDGATGATGFDGSTGATGFDGATGATGPVAGLDTQVIYNDSGSAAGATYLTYTTANGRVYANANIVSTNIDTGTIVVVGGVGISGNINAGNLTSAGLIYTSNTTPATSNNTGAVQIIGGIGVGGNIYVGDRVGFVAANSVSAVYQVYNSSTNSLDTIFG